MYESVLEIDDNGNQRWYAQIDNRMKILHRNDGPAIIYQNGSMNWYIYGILHRDDGPAVIDVTNSGKTEMWYFQGLLHRNHGPSSHGPLFTGYHYYGQLHRIDGPAIMARSLGGIILYSWI